MTPGVPSALRARGAHRYIGGELGVAEKAFGLWRSIVSALESDIPVLSAVVVIGKKIPEIGASSAESLAVKEGINVADNAPNIVYRAITPADAAALDQGLGLTAKAPNGTWTAAEHVANTGPGAGGAAANSPWISTSRSLDVAKSYDGGNGVIAIDLNKAGLLQVEVWKTAPRVNGVEGLPYQRSIWAQEVTIHQEFLQTRF